MARLIYRRTRGPRLTDSWLVPFGLSTAVSAAFALFFANQFIREELGLSEASDRPWASFAGLALFGVGAIFAGAIVVGRLRNTTCGTAALIIDRDGMTTPDVFGRMLSFAWVDVLQFDLDTHAKTAEPTLLIRTKRGGLGSIELWDTDADPSTVIAQMEAFSGRKRG